MSRLTMKKNYVLVVPVWGEEHFRQWEKYSVPSYLAEGNIPYIAQHGNFSVLICTDQKTERLFAVSEKCRELRKHTKVFFLDIAYIKEDPSLKGYGYILTRCYNEAIKKFGTIAQDMQFVFLNSDFILADGVFKTVVRLVDQGAEVIFCPSFRAIRKNLLNKLDDLLAENKQVLCLSPRTAVRLAFDCLHPTISAQTINGSTFFSSIVTNQFYWKVGNNTILGHHFLIFPFVIKPEKIPLNPTGYIDYNAVYDFAPNSKITYISDSDDAFILEPEDIQKESETFFPADNKKLDIYSKGLLRWINPLHYENSKQLLVFHTQDLDRNSSLLKKEQKDFKIFFQGIDQKIKEA